MWKRIIIAMGACLSLAAPAVNHAATAQVGGGGSGVRVNGMVVGVTPINNAPDPTANKLKIGLVLPEPSQDTTLVAHCGFVFELGQSGNASAIIAVKSWNSGDAADQAIYNNLLSMARAALDRQGDVVVRLDDGTCEITDFGVL